MRLYIVGIPENLNSDLLNDFQKQFAPYRLPTEEESEFYRDYPEIPFFYEELEPIYLSIVKEDFYDALVNLPDGVNLDQIKSLCKDIVINALEHDCKYILSCIDSIIDMFICLYAKYVGDSPFELEAAIVARYEGYLPDKTGITPVALIKCEKITKFVEV